MRNIQHPALIVTGLMIMPLAALIQDSPNA